MAQLTGNERARHVQEMFTRIAMRYDLMNRLMTGGQDIHWRKRVIKLARLDNNTSLLDLGTGTGDLAREALSAFPKPRVVAADFTLEMMRVGQKTNPHNFSTADALQLPFSDLSFDAVVSGFLMRNVIDLQKALDEQYRVGSGASVFGASVTITDLRTGAIWYTTTDFEWGYYSVDLNTNYTGWAMGDTLLVQVTFNGMSGSASGVAGAPGNESFLWIDVVIGPTLSIPVDMAAAVPRD